MSTSMHVCLCAQICVSVCLLKTVDSLIYSITILRVQPGHSFHLFTKHQYEKMDEYQIPELLRTPLEELVLQIKILKLGLAEPFLEKALEAPPTKSVRDAVCLLKNLVSGITSTWTCSHIHVHVHLVIYMYMYI